MSKIILENMEFHAYHGCLEHEKTLGNTFLLSLSMKLNTEKAGQTDMLDDTLNYQAVYDVVKSEMEVRSNLIEHAAQRILDAVVKQFPQIKTVKLKLSKLAPPLGGKVEAVTIKLEKKNIK